VSIAHHGDVRTRRAKVFRERLAMTERCRPPIAPCDTETSGGFRSAPETGNPTPAAPRSRHPRVPPSAVRTESTNGQGRRPILTQRHGRTVVPPFPPTLFAPPRSPHRTRSVRGSGDAFHAGHPKVWGRDRRRVPIRKRWYTPLNRPRRTGCPPSPGRCHCGRTECWGHRAES